MRPNGRRLAARSASGRSTSAVGAHLDNSIRCGRAVSDAALNVEPGVGGNETSNIEEGVVGKCGMIYRPGKISRGMAESIEEARRHERSRARAPSGRVERPCDALEGITEWGRKGSSI
jgi:hypothetical protein